VIPLLSPLPDREKAFSFLIYCPSCPSPSSFFGPSQQTPKHKSTYFFFQCFDTSLYQVSPASRILQVPSFPPTCFSCERPIRTQSPFVPPLWTVFGQNLSHFKLVTISFLFSLELRIFEIQLRSQGGEGDALPGLKLPPVR